MSVTVVIIIISSSINIITIFSILLTVSVSGSAHQITGHFGENLPSHRFTAVTEAVFSTNCLADIRKKSNYNQVTTQKHKQRSQITTNLCKET